MSAAIRVEYNGQPLIIQATDIVGFVACTAAVPGPDGQPMAVEGVTVLCAVGFLPGSVGANLKNLGNALEPPRLVVPPFVGVSRDG